MRTLSILQPWAWLIVNGHKDIENRSWPTRYRGQFLVHAGKRWGAEQCDDLAFVREAFPAISAVLPERFDLGGIVGEATIVDCVTYYPSAWFGGPFGFVLRDAKPVQFQPCRGQLGWFDCPFPQRAQAQSEHV